MVNNRPLIFFAIVAIAVALVGLKKVRDRRGENTASTQSAQALAKQVPVTAPTTDAAPASTPNAVRVKPLQMPLDNSEQVKKAQEKMRQAMAQMPTDAQAMTNQFKQSVWVQQGAKNVIAKEAAELKTEGQARDAVKKMEDCMASAKAAGSIAISAEMAAQAGGGGIVASMQAGCLHNAGAIADKFPALKGKIEDLLSRQASPEALKLLRANGNPTANLAQ